MQYARTYQANGAQAETRSFCGSDSGTAIKINMTSSTAMAKIRKNLVSILDEKIKQSWLLYLWLKLLQSPCHKQFQRKLL